MRFQVVRTALTVAATALCATACTITTTATPASAYPARDRPGMEHESQPAPTTAASICRRQVPRRASRPARTSRRAPRSLTSIRACRGRTRAAGSRTRSRQPTPDTCCVSGVKQYAAAPPPPAAAAARAARATAAAAAPVAARPAPPRVRWQAAPPPGWSGTTWEPDRDRAGSDYRSFDLPGPRPELCRDYCLADAQCRAFTYVNPGYQGQHARCWLKHSVPAQRASRLLSVGREGGRAAATAATATLRRRPRARWSAAPPPGWSGTTWEPDIDRAGSDYTSFDLQAPRPELCRDRCLGEPQCRAFTYVNPGVQGQQARCWLKNERAGEPIIRLLPVRREDRAAAAAAAAGGTWRASPPPPPPPPPGAAPGAPHRRRRRRRRHHHRHHHHRRRHRAPGKRASIVPAPTTEASISPDQRLSSAATPARASRSAAHGRTCVPAFRGRARVAG